MLRAVALAARLDFTIDPPVLDAIRTHRHEIAKSSPPRLLEEYYKILRAGSSEKTFRWLAELRLLEPISAGAAPRRGRSSVAVARGARRLPPAVRVDAGHADERDPARQPARAARHSLQHDDGGGGGCTGRRTAPRPGAQARRAAAGAPRRRAAAADPGASAAPARSRREPARATRARHRHIFRDALTWLEIHGGRPKLSNTGRRCSAEVTRAAPEPAAAKRRRRREANRAVQSDGRRLRTADGRDHGSLSSSAELAVRTSLLLSDHAISSIVR